MSTPSEDADAIRNKRLQRLQSSQRPAVPDESLTIPYSKLPEQSPGASLPPSTPATLTSQLSGSSNRPVLEDAKATPDARPSPKLTGLSLQEAWEDRTLGTIFRAALRPSSRGVANDFMILDELRKDLEEEYQQNPGQVARLSIDNLDQLIISICLSGKVVPMDHLIGSWRRALKIQRDTPTSRLDAHKQHVLEEARRMCVSYAGHCVIMPDMFDGHQPPIKLEQRLLADLNEDQGLPQEVLYEFVAKFKEEPEFIAKFEHAFRMLSATLSTMTMCDNYKPYISALGRVAHIKSLAELFANLPEFLHDGDPQELEKSMLLGPFFRISPLQPEVSRAYFSSAKSKPANTIKHASDALRMSLQTLQNDLHLIVTAFCKTSDNVRSRMLSFFARVLNANHKRSAMAVDLRTVASDGFMLNITTVLCRLCQPFMDSTFSKIDRIDVQYFCRHPRLDIGDETKLNADNESSKEFYSADQGGKSNFISEVFFLAAAANHYGLVSAQNRHESLQRSVQEMEGHLERIEADRQNYLNSPQLPILDRNIQKIKDRVDQAIANRIALESALFDPMLSSAVLLFSRYQMAWLLRLVDPTHLYPSALLSLPLPEPSPKEFNHLPEYFVEDVGNLLSFISYYIPQTLISTQLTELLVFVVTFLRSSSYIQKANLKSKLVEIVFLGLHESPRGGPGYLAEIVHGNPFVLKHLMHALMNFYIEIERHYYEKFTVRYHVSKIIQNIWPNQAYRDKLEQESAHNVEFFIRFVALLLNDVTYVLDNALTALTEIHQLQHELEHTGSGLTQDQQAEKERKLSKAERDAQSYMQLGNETVVMLNLFTSAIGDAFVQPEIVYRLAGMLDYNLEALVGPRCSNLRVRNPEKYRFNPKALLGEITSVYLNLRRKSSFVEAIARDGRSYKPHTFDLAVSVLRKHALKANEDIDALAKLAQDVAQSKKRDEEGELELGDVPDEFCDPLMATLMEDPVILPSSKVTIDRQTIKVHLLSDATDPFNRAPLKIEDVIPDTELKAKIKAWVTERRLSGKRDAQSNGEGAMDMAMDVDSQKQD